MSSSSDNDDLQSYLKETKTRGPKDIDWSQLMESTETNCALDIDNALLEEQSGIELFLKTPELTQPRHTSKPSARRRSLSANPHLHAVSELAVNSQESSVSGVTSYTTSSSLPKHREEHSEQSQVHVNMRYVSGLSESSDTDDEAVSTSLHRDNVFTIDQLEALDDDIPHSAVQTPSEHTNTPSEHTNTPSEHTIEEEYTFSEHSIGEEYTPSEHSIGEEYTPSEHTNTPSEHTNTPNEHTNTPGEHTNTPSEHTNTPSEHTNTPSEHTNTPREHTNTPGEHTIEEEYSEQFDSTVTTHDTVTEESYTDEGAVGSVLSYSQSSVDLLTTAQHKQFSTEHKQDASVQTTPYLMTFDPPAAPPLTPILPCVLSAHTLATLSSYSPASVALTDLIQSQLALIRVSMDSSRQHLVNVCQSTQSEHNYTTLEETQAYIKQHRPHILSMKEAKLGKKQHKNV